MSGSGMHPLIRTGIATGLRALGPSLLNLLVRKIEGNGRKKNVFMVDYVLLDGRF